MPFDLKGTRNYSSNSVGYTRTSGTTFNSSVSAMPTDRFNYSLSANAGSKGNRGASASASYAFDAIQTNMGCHVPTVSMETVRPASQAVFRVRCWVQQKQARSLPKNRLALWELLAFRVLKGFLLIAPCRRTAEVIQRVI